MLSSIQLIREILINKEDLIDINHIANMKEFFQQMEYQKNDLNYAYLMNYIYTQISSDNVAKRKTSARVFEDFLAELFNGDVQDDKVRNNNTKYETVIKDIYVQEYVISNMREKVDIVFPNMKISVKTLMASNNEINMGSFEKKALFSGFDIVEFLTERGKNNQYGLGSKK